MSLHDNDGDSTLPFLFLVHLPWPVVLLILLLLGVGYCAQSCIEDDARPTWDKNATMGASIWLRRAYDGLPSEVISTRVEKGSIYHINARVGKGDNIQIVSFDCDGRVIGKCEACE